MNKKSIYSISNLLRFFQQTQTQIFWVDAIHATILLNLHQYIPTFRMIACHDPHNGSLPFIFVPQSLKDHKCGSNGKSCQNTLFTNPEVISYIKNNSQNPKIVTFATEAQSQRICKQNNFSLWCSSIDKYNYLGNKVEIVDTITKLSIPFIPNICSKISSYNHFLELTKHFKTQKIVVQDQMGMAGIGTMFIFNQDDYKVYQSDLQNGSVFKIMPYRNLKAFEVNAVATKTGTFVGPLASELIGHKELVKYKGGYCGNQIRKSYFQNTELNKKVKQQMFKYTERFGNYIYRQNLYKGFFGLDFTFDIDTNQIFFMEINPRLTGPTAITFIVYQAEGHKLPLYLYHCAQYMDIELNLNIQAINQEWIDETHYNNEISFILMRPLQSQYDSLPYSFSSGYWILKDDNLFKLDKQINFKLSQLKQNQFLFIPNQGIQIGSIITRRAVQDYNFKLTEESRKIIDKFTKLRLKDINK